MNEHFTVNVRFCTLLNNLCLYNECNLSFTIRSSTLHMNYFTMRHNTTLSFRKLIQNFPII